MSNGDFYAEKFYDDSEADDDFDEFKDLPIGNVMNIKQIYISKK